MRTNDREHTLEESKHEFEDGDVWNVERMQHLAKVQKVHNEEAFGPVTEDTIVIAIQGLNPMSHVAPGSRSPRARLSALKPICGQQNPAGEGVIMLNFMNRSIFEISVGSLKLQDATKFTTKIVFGTMKLRYSASTTLNLSWEVAFFMKFSVAMTDLYTVIFKT